jgi:hypothetical protein
LCFSLDGWALQASPFFRGQTPPEAALLGMKRKQNPPADPDTVLFQSHHSLKELHRKAKGDLRKKKRAEYAAKHLSD